MKRVYLIGRLLPARLFLCLLLLFAYSFSPAQLLPSNPARFGVDGDIIGEARQNGSFDPLGTHDWFPGPSAGSYGVFDTTGAAALKNVLSAGSNYAFVRKMHDRSYTVRDGLLMLGGTYARDYFGLDVAGARSEKTMFVPSAPNNKSSSAPTSWTTVAPGNALPGKTDIMDAYIHMRRNGTSVAAATPSNLLIYLAASTLSTGGDHYLDFELYKSDLSFDSATGLFTSAGPALTGGRNIWEFNADGSVQTFGEMALSFSFNSTQVSDMGIYIWVPYSTYTSVDPKDFDFVQGGWEGALKSGYGYARIGPNAGAALQAWGTVNTASVPGPAWGTSSREGSSATLNYYAADYSAGQLAEAAIDLSSLGIDPAFASGPGKCRSPYVKVLVKSRSSSSFNSSLQDFVAPFALFDDPVPPAAIAEPGLITCAQPTQTLVAQNAIEGAVYKWTTADGAIVSGGNTAQAVVARGGRYTLSAALYEGCTESVAEVVVPADTTRPVASAGYTGILGNTADSYVVLKGGDAEKSNYATPFGGSAGLGWLWTAEGGFSASEQNPKAYQEGVYRLTVTELRNGCTATDSVRVTKVEQMVLPLTLMDFAGYGQDGAVHLSWVVGENEGAEWFEVQRAGAGEGFSTIAVVMASSKPGQESYVFRDRWAGQELTYRLKAVDGEQKVLYSRLVHVRAGGDQEKAHISVVQNPVVSDLVVSYYAPSGGPVRVRVYTAAGQLVYDQRQECYPGNNRLVVAGGLLAVRGQYLVEVADTGLRVSRTRAIKL